MHVKLARLGIWVKTPWVNVFWDGDFFCFGQVFMIYIQKLVHCILR